MSYYRLVANFNNLFPQESRSVRSSSLPREMPNHSCDRYSRASSVGRMSRLSFEPALPFRSRAMSVPAFDYLEDARSRYARNLQPSWYSYYQEPRSYTYDYGYDYYQPRYHYSCEPSYYQYSYQPRLSPSYGSDYYQDSAADYDYPYSYRDIPSISLSDYYGNNKYSDYLYSSTRDLLGSWKHYNRSTNTLNMRNQRATSPLVSRELDRYFSTSGKTNYSGDIGSRGAADFRHYNYGSVPYYGTSDNYHNLNKMFRYQNRKEGRAF